MSIKTKTKIVKTSNLEAIILTDETLPVSEICHIKKTDSGFRLVSKESQYDIQGSFTGLETVYLWSSSQSGSECLSEPKELGWIA